MKFPNMREELKDYVLGLSSYEYQKRHWVRREASDSFAHDEFSYTVHFLFDDTNLSNDASGYVGLFLKDQEEADMVDALIRSIDKVFQECGLGKSDETYINSSAWCGVIAAAKALYIKMND